MKTLKAEECVGKTVRKILTTYQHTLVVFEDGTCFVTEATTCHDALSVDILDELNPLELGEATIVESGLMTREEYTVLSVTRRKQMESIRDAHERNQYEKLRAKYG